ncbi:MAG: type II toxin-antitoxin system prevent-host-death family antitoxin [Holophagales bacterium]|nr:type II toxin-antitoxin system prevent-host-death family antitoxin [Holophagales bacterium]
MTKVNVQEAKTQLSRLLGLVEAGEEVVIARYGKPVAKLVRVAPPAPRRTPGTWEGAIRIAEDFDDEMPEEWIEALEP